MCVGVIIFVKLLVAICFQKSTYNIETNTFEEVFDDNCCFECTEINSNSYDVTSINMVNSSNTLIVGQDLSVFNGIGFTLDSSIGYLNFSKMWEGGLILKINGTCNLVNECKVSNCVVLPAVTSTDYNTFRNIACKNTSVTPVYNLKTYSK
ncbi:hypothetical protein ACTFIR_009646 [Dictyostelium discoideum]